MRETAIHRVTIELTNGTRIVMAPAWPTLPIQIVLPDVTGRIGKVLDVQVEDLLSILERIVNAKTATPP